MPIQAIFTDVGGVLIRTDNQDKRREWEARLGLPEETLTRVVFGPDSVPALLGELAKSWVCPARCSSCRTQC